MTGLLLRLYPAAWRERYEDEFLALLDERPISPFDAFDIVLGALDARFRPRSLAIELATRRNPPMNARLAGYAAIAGGGLILLMMLLAFTLPSPANAAAQSIYPLAAVALLVAVIGLSAVQGRRQPILAWAAVIVPAAGLLASLAGMLGMVSGDQPIVAGLSGWHLWSLGLSAFAIGSVLFALATLAVGVLSRGGAITLLVGALLVAGVFFPAVIGLINPDGVPVLAIAIFAGLVLFSAGWVWLGYAATRQQPIETASPVA